MKTLEDFNNFIKTDFSEVISTLEQERKAYLKYLLKRIALIISAFFAIILIFSGWVSCVISIIVFCIFLFFTYRRYSNYMRHYKEQLISGIVKFIDSSLSYSSFDYIPESKFLSSNIFSRQPDRYTRSDYISGRIGYTEIEFSLIHAEYKTETTRTDDDGHSRTEEEWHTIFKGFFFIADFNKSFSSQVLLWSDRSPKFLKTLKKKFSFLSGWQVINLQVINLEDPEFEKYYIAYGKYQVEARYILSTSLVRRIIDYRKRYGSQIYISFKDSLMYIGISGDFSFSPAILGIVKNYQRLKEIYETLLMVISIVDEFNLNTRIWSKQPAFNL